MLDGIADESVHVHTGLTSVGALEVGVLAALAPKALWDHWSVTERGDGRRDTGRVTGT